MQAVSEPGSVCWVEHFERPRDTGVRVVKLYLLYWEQLNIHVPSSMTEWRREHAISTLLCALTCVQFWAAPRGSITKFSSDTEAPQLLFFESAEGVSFLNALDADSM